MQGIESRIGRKQAIIVRDNSLSSASFDLACTPGRIFGAMVINLECLVHGRNVVACWTVALAGGVEAVMEWEVEVARCQ